ncbi:ABC-type glycerol-3-phosphate transport system substrate-binding protein [Paraburkholderia youngii]
MLRLTTARVIAALLASLGLSFGSAAHAQGKQLTLCWAAWDPANALVELSKDFTAKTGIAMKFEFVPWTSYADRFINELNSHGKLCDLIIGDSQWIGGAAVNGHYVKLNDFFDKNKISMNDFVPATVVGYSDMAKEHAELLGAARNGGRRRLDVSQGLVCEARTARGVQTEVQARTRTAHYDG